MENVVEASTMFAAMTETMAPAFEVTDIETAVAVVQDINDLQVTDTERRLSHCGRHFFPGINIGVASFTVESSTQSSVNESTADDLSDDEVVLLTSNEDIAIDVGDASTYLRLPDNFGERITDQENLRAVFVVYRRPLLFMSRWLQEENGIGRVFDRSINTRVLSATVSNKGREITYLSGGILQQRFMPLETNGKIFNPVCVFWDFDADDGNGNWSSDGCTYQGRTRNGQILCQCDHLTNFAVLMDIYGHGVINPTEEKILEIMSILGCSISIIGLITTIIVYMTLKSLRRLQPSRILVGLCLSLLGLYICFLFVASFDNDSIPTVPCNILAGLFHFFALNALSWMAVEGLNMYLLFVKVFDTHVHSFMKRAIFVTTVGPLVIVGVTAGATRSNYIRSDLCFLQQWPLIGGVLVPIGVIIITNTVIFVLVFRQLLKSVAGKKSEKRKKQQRLKRARNALSIMTLMGLTWGLGFLSIIYALSGVIQWLFTIINSMQGFTIFLLYCMRNPTVARFFKKRLPCCALETISAATPSSSKAVGSSAQNASNAFTPASVPISSVEERRYASH
ncbi:hypothetical protein BSL78_17944 [Apostichopus japonicus]|uniref:G-protein coupled receptor n=1 Tax=Stichopus japonicus TaxID=307972 RepID=A0A2G8KB24_STIJA|nr:hypothetical protein BSL78_17944 [Apostichopus japonicus]